MGCTPAKGTMGHNERLEPKAEWSDTDPTICWVLSERAVGYGVGRRDPAPSTAQPGRLSTLRCESAHFKDITRVIAYSNSGKQYQHYQGPTSADPACRTLYFYLRAAWARGGAGAQSTPLHVPASPVLRRNAAGAEPDATGNLQDVYQKRWTDVHEGAFLDDIEKHWMEREFDEHVHISIGTALSELMKSRQGVDAENGTHTSPFYMAKPPWFPIKDYIDRVREYIKLSSETLIVACIYMDRACFRSPAYILTPCTVHRLALTCCMLANKYYDEQPAKNTVWAQVGGIGVDVLNALEVDLLAQLEFSLEDQMGANTSPALRPTSLPRSSGGGSPKSPATGGALFRAAEQAASVTTSITKSLTFGFIQ